MIPVFTISIGDEDLTNVYQQRLISLEITDNTAEQADRLTIELSDHDRKIELPESGAVIQIGLGYDENIRDMGKFVVDSISIGGPPDSVTIGAHAAPFARTGEYKPFQTRRSRSFDNITLSDLIRTIAGSAGLATAVAPELSSIRISHLDQTNESDMNLLTRLARDYGALMKPTSGHLVFLKRGQSRSVSGKPLDKLTIDRSECSSYSAEWSKRANFSKVKTKSHNVETGETEEIEESDDDEGPVLESPVLYPDAESARRAAASTLEQNARSETISLTLAGRPDMIAEGAITLTGFKSKMNGEWLVKSVQHSFSKSGFTTTVQGETSANRAEKKKKKAKRGKTADLSFT